MGSLGEDHEEFMKNNKLKLKAQQRFRSQNNNAFVEEIYKIALISNEDKRTQPIDFIETYVRNKQLLNMKVQA